MDCCVANGCAYSRRIALLLTHRLFEFVVTFPNSKGAIYHLASVNRSEAEAWVKAIRTVAVCTNAIPFLLL